MMNQDRARWCITGVEIGLPLLILMSYGWMARLPDLRLAVPEWVGASAGIVVLICLCFFGDCRKKDAHFPVAFVILLGAVFRAMFLPRPPELSDDIYRYVFDGRMLLSGHNPYLAAPMETLASHPWLAEIAARVNHVNLPTIYPPAAQLVFAAGGLFGEVLGMKCVLVGLDIFTCVLMARILEILRLPSACLILYAWHPLTVLEISGSGHIDAAGMFFMFLAVFILLRETSRPKLSGWGAGICFAAAILTKWLPLIFLPGMLMLAGNRKGGGLVGGCLAGILVMMGFFWPGLLNGFDTLYVYAVNWEFSGVAFRMLRNVSGSGGMARLALAALFTGISGMLYVRVFRAAGGFRGRKTAESRVRVLQSLYGITQAFLLLTPTLHPWYALYLAAFLPFAGGAAGIVLSWSVLLGYRVVILYALSGQWVESDLIPVLIAAGPAVAFTASVFIKDNNLNLQFFQKKQR